MGFGVSEYLVDYTYWSLRVVYLDVDRKTMIETILAKLQTLDTDVDLEIPVSMKTFTGSHYTYVIRQVLFLFALFFNAEAIVSVKISVCLPYTDVFFLRMGIYRKNRGFLCLCWGVE